MMKLNSRKLYACNLRSCCGSVDSARKKSPDGPKPSMHSLKGSSPSGGHQRPPRTFSASFAISVSTASGRRYSLLLNLHELSHSPCVPKQFDLCRLAMLAVKPPRPLRVG